MALKKPSDFFGNKKTPLDEVKESYDSARPEKIEQVSEAFDAFKSNLNHANHNLWLFLIIGYLGSFTTFSSLSLEAHELVEKSSYFIFTAYILVHFILGISLTFLGLKISSS